MEHRVAFPMYVLPSVQEDMCALWTLLRRRLEQVGMYNLPVGPEFDDPFVGGEMPETMLMWQYCGFPYVTQWRREGWRPFACLHYDAPHCEGKRHRSVIVVRKDDAAQDVAELRGRRVAVNGYDSNTGMNLLRHTVTPFAENGAFFGEVIETGTHVGSLRAVVQGCADVASIDCVTFAYIGDYLPELAGAVRVLTVTAPSPALPLFTRADAPEALRETLYQAWKGVFADGTAEGVLARLRLRGIEPVTEGELDVIADYQRQAVEQGYAVLG